MGDSTAAASYQEAILWPQLVIRDLGLSGQVRRGVIVRGDKLGMLIFVKLIRSGLQDALLQLNAPLELHIPERTERHEQAKQPLLTKKKNMVARF